MKSDEAIPVIALEIASSPALQLRVSLSLDPPLSAKASRNDDIVLI